MYATMHSEAWKFCGLLCTHAHLQITTYVGHAVGTSASAVYSDAADTATTAMGQTATGNVLANANVPSGQTALVTGFSIAGSTQVFPAGSTTTLTDPLTGQPIGTLTISASGAYTFDPEDGYIGPVPAVNVYSKTSTGTTAVSSLTIDVLPGKDGNNDCFALRAWVSHLHQICSPEASMPLPRLHCGLAHASSLVRLYIVAHVWSYTT
jgi:hypothetical protein